MLFAMLILVIERDQACLRTAVNVFKHVVKQLATGKTALCQYTALRCTEMLHQEDKSDTGHRAMQRAVPYLRSDTPHRTRLATCH